jgi:hypothetical protein
MVLGPRIALLISALCWAGFWVALLVDGSKVLTIALFASGLPSQVLAVAAGIRGRGVRHDA